MNKTNTTIDINQQYLILNVGKHYFAANVQHIKDVIKSTKITPVPLSKKTIKGLLNLRGHIVTEIDVATMLGIESTHDKKDCYTIVINSADEFYSLSFDGIGDVIHIKKEEIEPLPQTVNKEWDAISEGVFKLPDHLLVILNIPLFIEKVIGEDLTILTAQSA